MSGYGASWYRHTLRVVNGRLVVVLPTRRTI
jgi:hypothetical protein